jgi:hypothetical protein
MSDTAKFCRKCGSEFVGRCGPCLKALKYAWAKKNKDKVRASSEKFKGGNALIFRSCVKCSAMFSGSRCQQCALHIARHDTLTISKAHVARVLKMPAKDISQDILEIKREQIFMLRLTKQLNEALNEATKGESE